MRRYEGRPAVTDDSPLVMNRTFSHPLTWLVCLLALCCPVTIQAQARLDRLEDAYLNFVWKQKEH